MDGFEENDRIIVVAATNLASTLDPALLRPGRFDRKIEISLPNPKDRLDILKIHLKNVSSLTKVYDCRNRMKYQTNNCRLLLIRLKDWQGQSLKI